jgi:phosphopantetheinyl transferase (holo-ACP synthase)
MTDGAGKPYMRIWQGSHKYAYYPLSISHDKDYVVAIVMSTPLTIDENEIDTPKTV